MTEPQKKSSAPLSRAAPDAVSTREEVRLRTGVLVLRDCDGCGVSYEALRPESRFCSGTCRVRAYRARVSPEAAEAVVEPVALPETQRLSRPEPAATAVTPPAAPARLRVLCRQDVCPAPWSEEVVWTFRHERERPETDVEVTCYADGSAPCSRCDQRHPWDQMLAREGLRPAGVTIPMGWGQRRADEAGVATAEEIRWPTDW